MKKYFLAFVITFFVFACCALGYALFLKQQEVKELKTRITSLEVELHPTEASINGEIFIVTKGGQNFKLGLVEVGIIPMQRLMPYLKKKEQERDDELQRINPLIEAAELKYNIAHANKERAFQEYCKFILNQKLQSTYEKSKDAWHQTGDEKRKLLQERDSLLSGDFVFSALPAPVMTSKTNSDGKFILNMPTQGIFGLAAKAQRVVGDTTEKYYWLLSVSMEGKKGDTIILSNDNLGSADSPHSLIRIND